MKKIILFLFVLVTLLLLESGCQEKQRRQSGYWYKEGTTFNQCLKDWQDCNLQINKVTAFGERMYGKENYSSRDECMRSKGYQFLPEQKIPEGVWRTKGFEGPRLAGRYY